MGTGLTTKEAKLLCHSMNLVKGISIAMLWTDRSANLSNVAVVHLIVSFCSQVGWWGALLS